MTPSSIGAPSAASSRIVRIRAPPSATVPVGLAAGTVIDSETPVAGAANLAAFSSVGADGNSVSRRAVNTVGPRLQWSCSPLLDQLI